MELANDFGKRVLSSGGCFFLAPSWKSGGTHLYCRASVPWSWRLTHHHSRAGPRTHSVHKHQAPCLVCMCASWFLSWWWLMAKLGNRSMAGRWRGARHCPRRLGLSRLPRPHLPTPPTPYPSCGGECARRPSSALRLLQALDTQLRPETFCATRTARSNGRQRPKSTFKPVYYARSKPQPHTQTHAHPPASLLRLWAHAPCRKRARLSASIQNNSKGATRHGKEVMACNQL